ncbi:hypothetical protein [Methylorubrum suomiense]|uniref:DUF1640 domain-containing protein n=1 Tax=Methylorubrum suomiense TaxID=144191 RepID=A0ABQ4V344_9HYPH|nr:hypothetical protein [Methylorubrum suomiense]GJE77302.1 hypothetical protein BGCPKDLD_3905 [Methylorubrum suomiense]
MLDAAIADDRLEGAAAPMSENNEQSNTGALTALQIAQAVTNTELKELKGILSELRGEVRELKSTFATKDEFKGLQEQVNGLKNNQSWIVKIILGAVVAAVLGVVLVKGGVPHP